MGLITPGPKNEGFPWVPMVYQFLIPTPCPKKSPGRPSRVAKAWRWWTLAVDRSARRQGPAFPCSPAEVCQGREGHLGVNPKIIRKHPKSSILIGFSIIFTIHFGVITPIFENIHHKLGVCSNQTHWIRESCGSVECWSMSFTIEVFGWPWNRPEIWVYPGKQVAVNFHQLYP